ncbi:MAG: hypothetical protein EOM14_07290 [Clostridia bacterium]|nr:hypothetical protein [Clostridia bacterium]
MELKLENGNYVPANYQGFAQISEMDELAQRLMMKLTAKRGKFLPLPDYGSRLYLLPKIMPSQRETTARQYVIEALADEEDVELTDFEFSQTGISAQMSATFSYKGDTSLVITTKV